MAPRKGHKFVRTPEQRAAWAASISKGKSWRSVEERFWSKVDRSGGPDACWPWTGAFDSHGYGMFHVGKREGVTTHVERAHRVALRLVGRPLPDGKIGMHSCDNPPCCNPAHVAEGTPRANAHDRDAKGRQVAHLGEAHGRAKLTDDNVRFMRARFAEGVSAPALAELFQVSHATAWAAATGRTWRHL